jgi:uncharacterized membrane protein YozB (DUF420 family)
MNTTLSGDSSAFRRFQTLPGDHRFFSCMAIVTAATILAGFSSTYLPKVVSGAPALPPIIHLHAAVFASWLAVFVAQTILVLSGRPDVHRRLGIAAVALAALLLNLGSIVVFATLVAAGWYCRRNPQTHKRLMLTATVGALVGPGVSLAIRQR